MTKPNITMGQKPDGSPVVTHVDFGSNVGVTMHGKILAQGRATDPASARALAGALLAAAEWIESDRSAEIEAQR